MKETAQDVISKERAEFLKLRSLLLDTDYERVLKQFSQNEIHHLAELLPAAIIENIHKGNTIDKALSPIVDSALDQSIKNSPQKITNVFYPIIGPAIRKAVAKALFDMVQTLNQLLENSLSVQSLVWRFKSWRAGKSYAEYVLLKTLKYRVEQVFIIHRETGLLINSAIAPNVSSQDPDLVSSMLTAINDFVADSFSETDNNLDSLSYGEFKLQIIVGPKAIIAASVKGTVSKEIDNKLTVCIEQIHGQYSEQLSSFDGDKDQWKHLEPLLEQCLISKSTPNEKSAFPWPAVVVLFGIFSYVSFTQYQQYLLAQESWQVIEKIEDNPNYVLINHNRKDQHLDMTILRASRTEPAKSALAKLDGDRLTIAVKEHLLPLNFEPIFNAYLNVISVKPENLTLHFYQHAIKLTGTATNKELEQFKKNINRSGVIQEIDSHDVQIIEIKPISITQQQREKYQLLLTELNANKFYFDLRATTLTPASKKLLIKTTQQLKAIIELATAQDITIEQILITGFADAVGSIHDNQKISLERANSLKEILVANGVSEQLIVVWGVGNISTLTIDNSKQRHAQLTIYDNDIPNKEQR